MKILVTGGAGFIASHLVDELLARGHGVAIIDNFSTGKKTNVAPGARVYRVDVRDSAGLNEIFAKELPDVVSHHAAQTDVRASMRDAVYDADVNIQGSLNVIASSVHHRVKRLMFASTSAVYADTMGGKASEQVETRPASAYGLSKSVVEQYLRLYRDSFGLNYIVLRYGNVYGPRQNPEGECGAVAIFTRQLINGETPVLYGDGQKTRDYIYVSDVIAANMAAMFCAYSGVFNIGCGREVTDRAVLDTVAGALAKRVVPLYRPRRNGELQRVCLDISKAMTEMKWQPSVAFEQGVARTVDHYVSETAAITMRSAVVGAD